jgi:hypothetical protein
MKIENIELIIDNYRINSKQTDRYTSFDYCYNYFRKTADLTLDIEKSCLVLGFYLASWGMFRGSSFLLQKSLKHFQGLIEYYATLEKKTWEIDIDNYDNESNKIIIEIYNNTKRLVVSEEHTHLTLTSKIMLGVFGFIPAFDQYFRKTFSELFKERCAFTSVNNNSLNCIKEFYENNKNTIDHLSEHILTLDFITGKKTNIKYPKAKIIDMYGFTNSLPSKKLHGDNGFGFDESPEQENYLTYSNYKSLLESTNLPEEEILSMMEITKEQIMKIAIEVEGTE